jgi:hypothetical protein
MPDDTWINLSARERSIILHTLSSIHQGKRKKRAELDALRFKLTHSEPHPKITIGVHGGQVEWTSGNPFPIRICDYDGQGGIELPDLDERGRQCRISIYDCGCSDLNW